MPLSDTPDIDLARKVLRGQYLPPEECLGLAKRLKARMAFHLAWQVLARARCDPALGNQSALRLLLAQQQALCTYKDHELPAEQRFARAREILERDCQLATSTDQETLGLAGAVHKYRWAWDAQRQHLERSLSYYLRGYEAGDPADPSYDNGFTGINAAFVLDQLASIEEAEARAAQRTSSVAAGRREKAKEIRQDLAAKLTERLGQQGNEWLATQWWFLATLAEASFGLGDYGKAVEWLQKANRLPGVSDWEKEATVRQLAALARLHELDRPASHPWRVFQEGLGISELAARAAVAGKVGLALSGGGFRASLFHIGVLARLAELDVLRHVEVLSCVSGGSIVGAQYYLEVRHLLQQKPDAQITRDDYIALVRRVAEDFLAGVQENIRTRVAAEFTTNVRMMLSSTYSHTERIAELFEALLFARVPDGGKERWLNELFIRPAGEGPEFQPKLHNWRRQAKAPVLILNATTLNTCHNWQFTVSFMGEPPALIDPDADGNYRLRRMYYAQAPDGYKRFRLGRAVAASACVPGLFTPLALPDLYPRHTVRLVDGGVYDNQGAAGLLEQECSVLLVSDASGQTDPEADPSRSPLGVLFRSDNVLQARVRLAQLADESARRRSGLLRGLMAVHLKKGLDVDPVDWKDSPDPHEASEEARPVERRGPVTPYGVWKEVQRHLAALRTDLDSFSDVEAFALMTSGYLMTTHEFPRGVPGFPVSGQDPVPWRFLAALRSWVQGPVASSDERLGLLQVGRNQVFKIWRLSRPLQVAAGVVALLVLATLAWVCYAWWSRPLVTVGDVALTLLGALAALVVGSTLVRLIRFPQTATWALGASLVGALAARLHLLFFDPLFLKRGQLPHLSHEQTLEWVRQQRAWRRARKARPIYARPTEPDEEGKAFHTAEGTVQRPQAGHWLCVGVAEEPWFQKKEKIDSKYEPAGEQNLQFRFDPRPFRYQVYKPRGDVTNLAAQVQGPGVASFSFRPSYDPTQPVMAPAGAYLVTDDTTDPYRDDLRDVWVVQQALFESTYELLADQEVHGREGPEGPVR
jgi:predicted acylesterase/phospholipase RssA